MSDQPNELPKLSVSALNDYHRCGYYYKLRRVDKVPVEETHHMAAGSILHEAVYMAYGKPVDLHDNGRFLKSRWEVYPDARFDPQLGLYLFDALWEGDVSGDAPAEVWAAYEMLSETTPPPRNFKPGPKASLKKAKNQRELKEAWKQHFREMLEQVLEKPFDLPVIEIERKLTYNLGSTEATGYADLVLEDHDGEIGVDLKSGYNKPSDAELFFDPQMNAYYQSGFKSMWYYHMRSNTIVEVEPNLQLQAWFGGVAEETSRAIQAGYFPKRFSKDCVYCPFRAQCIGT